MSLFGRPGRPGAGERRRSGPPGEERWWDPTDQAAAEAAALARRDLPRRWRSRLLVNNAEQADPFDGVTGADRLVAATAARRRTALDEGAAFAARDHQLVVSRVEAFADGDDSEHREAWQADGARILTALYHRRWRERDIVPGWVETTGPELDVEPAPEVDWFRVEDHTDRRDESGVLLYEHVQIWRGRALATLTVRHPPGTEVEPLIHRLVSSVGDRLGPFTTSATS